MGQFTNIAPSFHSIRPDDLVNRVGGIGLLESTKQYAALWLLFNWPSVRLSCTTGSDWLRCIASVASCSSGTSIEIIGAVHVWKCDRDKATVEMNRNLNDGLPQDSRPGQIRKRWQNNIFIASSLFLFSIFPCLLRTFRLDCQTLPGFWTACVLSPNTWRCHSDEFSIFLDPCFFTSFRVLVSGDEYCCWFLCWGYWRQQIILLASKNIPVYFYPRHQTPRTTDTSSD